MRVRRCIQLIFVEYPSSRVYVLNKLDDQMQQPFLEIQNELLLVKEIFEHDPSLLDHCFTIVLKQERLNLLGTNQGCKLKCSFYSRTKFLALNARFFQL